MTTRLDTTAEPQEASASNAAGAGNGAIAGILAYLRDRRLQPGDRLPSERDLAERLGVGRNAVREALATLVTLRIVESRPNSGIYLRHVEREGSFEALVMLTDMGAVPTPVEVAETMEVRGHLEVLAAGLACQRRTEADLARMEAVLQRTEQVLAEGGNIAAADTEFHVALVDATHNSVLVRVLHAFYRFTGRRREAMFADTVQGRASLLDHRRLLGHIRARDAAKAQLLILRHMDRARSYWSSVLGDTD
ncbi:FadR/GntR family transcriptional regulator [Variovorax sp. Varisp41]|jgi:GntR family transcriptional repressor for pyruvate dehydrogenase complex|uniref:FadR/GntR family transcriptional regulator n=1 Tax=unclassified Variovorax TaxID=663243 RepID=UPI0021BA3F8B|nr:FadR/GntR family transcriptional regulator [Variovorax sp. CY25R-8]MCT8178983.1 FadR family transcriptional regulator [Variovorax sp. CY25R-8]